jgi:hypothetical protein
MIKKRLKRIFWPIFEEIPQRLFLIKEDLFP